MLNSVDPNQPAPGTLRMEDQEVGNGISIPQTPVPGANPMDTTAMSALKGSKMEADAMKAATTSSGGKSGGGIGKAVGSIGGTLLGGPIGGMVGGFLGDIFGGLFSEGGPVNYANGGQAMNPDNTYGPGQTIEPSGQSPLNPPTRDNSPYMLGYLTGALHQRDFNGTPETLEQAAHMIKQMMSGQQGTATPPEQGFAQGGMPQQSANPAMQPPNPMQSSPQPQLPPQPQMLPRQGFMQPNMGMQRLATGGPPLQPGEPFMGEGEVNGPGGPQDDAIPAKLSDGEYVMSAPAVAFFGVEKMDQMNEKGKQGFMQSQAQVQANQGAPPGGVPQGTGVPAGGPPGMPPGAPPMPPGGGGAMAPMPPMPTMQAKGGPAIRRTRNSGFFGI